MKQIPHLMLSLLNFCALSKISLMSANTLLGFWEASMRLLERRMNKIILFSVVWCSSFKHAF